MAEVSMERHGHAKQLVVFFGAAGIGTGGGWGADAVLRACCKVVCRPRASNQRRSRVVLVDEHRTTRTGKLQLCLEQNRTVLQKPCQGPKIADVQHKDRGDVNVGRAVFNLGGGGVVGLRCGGEDQHYSLEHGDGYFMGPIASGKAPVSDGLFCRHSVGIQPGFRQPLSGSVATCSLVIDVHATTWSVSPPPPPSPLPLPVSPRIWKDWVALRDSLQACWGVVAEAWRQKAAREEANQPPTPRDTRLQAGVEAGGRANGVVVAEAWRQKAAREEANQPPTPRDTRLQAGVEAGGRAMKEKAARDMAARDRSWQDLVKILAGSAHYFLHTHHTRNLATRQAQRRAARVVARLPPSAFRPAPIHLLPVSHRPVQNVLQQAAKEMRASFSSASATLACLTLAALLLLGQPSVRGNMISNNGITSATSGDGGGGGGRSLLGNGAAGGQGTGGAAFSMGGTAIPGQGIQGARGQNGTDVVIQKGTDGYGSNGKQGSTNTTTLLSAIIKAHCQLPDCPDNGGWLVIIELNTAMYPKSCAAWQTHDDSRNTGMGFKTLRDRAPNARVQQPEAQ
ncbi:hypothetical protein QJQ45_019061 [Haematococcus lacustris]|nr:hypothetical protein QJQ45_019061 [Haematococcus lacustris]